MDSVELQILLDLSSAIASVRNKDDLFHLILEKINPVFNCKREALILTINEEEGCYQLMLIQSAIPEEEKEFYKTHKFPIDDYLRQMLEMDEAWLFPTAPYIAANPDQIGPQFVKKLGIEEIMTCRLMVSGKKIGCFSLLAEKINHFNKEQLPLFKSVAEMVAVAVSNILSGEEAQLKELQKLQLLNISKNISTIRDKNDLFHLITNDLKSFIRFDVAVISLINEESNSFGLFLTDAGEALSNQKEFQKAKTADYPIEKGSIPHRVIRSSEPLIVDIEKEHFKNPEVPYLKDAYELGLIEEIATRLVHSGKIIGALTLVSTQHGTYTERDVQTLQSLSSFFAIALNNILANQELEQREHQKSQLLKISTHIATVRDKNDLFRLIASDMKAFIDFDDVVIAIIDEEKESFKVFLSDVTGTTSAHKDYQKAITQSYPLKKGSFGYANLQSKEPFIIDIEKLHFERPEMDNLRYAYNLGMREEILTPLTYSGRVIGMMGVLSKTKNRFNQKDVDTVHSLSSLLAIALNNILSNQAIEKREQQKSQLLNISAHIATIREKEDLFHLIASDVKSFIYFDDLFIASVDEEKQTFGVFLSDPGETTKQHQHYRHAISYVYPLVKGTIPYKIAASEKPFIFDVEAEYSKDPSDYLRFAHEFGMKEVLVARLVNSGKVIGLLGMLSKVYRYTETDINTLYSLSSLLAIALYNILANEEIYRREYQKSQLLKISNNIAHIRNKKDLFHLMARELKSFIHFDDAVLATIDVEKQTFSVYLSDPAGTSSIHPDYKTATTKTYSFDKDSPPYNVIRSDKPLILDIKKEHFKHPGLEYMRYAYNFGMKEEIITRLIHSGRVIGMFAILSKEQGRYTEADVETLQSLSSLVAVALNNILANEEIENLTKQLAQDNLYLSEEIKNNYNFEEIIGESPPIQEVFKKIVQVASADSTVLLLGETGTGKELIARAIHNLSSRKGRPLIKVNCAALPAQLIESELFGHEKGSFTGATDRRIGKFEMADGSTIFLDEMGELPLELQAKLLRVLQEKEIERIGGEKIIKVDVRIIAATNRNLEKEVFAGKFRSDLYYRLNIYPIELPPLRERKADIPLLTKHFTKKFSGKLGKKITGLSESVLQELLAYDWPGNIRELEHTLERSMLMTDGKLITNVHLSRPFIQEPTSLLPETFQPKSLEDNERDLILKTLQYTQGRIRGKNGAAELLQILPTTLEARMKKLGIKKEFKV